MMALKKGNKCNNYKLIKRNVSTHLASAFKKSRIDLIVERASSMCDFISVTDPLGRK